MRAIRLYFLCALRNTNWQQGAIKFTKRLLVTYLIGFFAFSGVAGLFLFNPFGTKEASAAWFNDNWRYRQPVTFTHNADIAAERRVQFTLDTAELISAGLLQSDCDDIRFTDITGALIKYDITGSCNTATTTIELIIPQTFNSSTNTFYVYYDNPSAITGEMDSTNYTNLDPSGGDPTLLNPTSTGQQEKGTAPVFYLKFDDATGTTAQDSTSRNNDGTISGATWQTEDRCVSGKCLYFNGSTDSVTVSNTVSNVKSISFWVRPNTFTTITPLIDLDGTNKVYTNNGGGLTTNGMSNVQMYVNGIAVSSSSIPPDTWTYITITHPVNETASSIKIGYDGTNYLKGFMDEVKFYEDNLTASQVKSIYNSSSNPDGLSTRLGNNSQNLIRALSSGLTGYWNMNETSGTNIVDYSGNSYTGTLNGSTRDAGKYGGGYNFPGNNTGYISTSQAVSNFISASGSTISLWVKPEAAAPTVSNSYDGTYIFGESTGYTGITQASISGQDQLWVHNYDGSDDRVGITYTLNEWLYITLVHSGGTLFAYKNGVLVGATPSGDTSSLGGLVLIATGYSGLYFDGSIDEVRVYNRGLSSDEVFQLYYWAPGPIGKWDFEEGTTGTTFYDSSGYGRNGSSVNPITPVKGRFGNAISNPTDDTSQAISVGSASDIDDLGQLTVSAWVNFPTLPTLETVAVTKITNITPVSGWEMGVTSNGRAFFMADCAPDIVRASQNGVITANAWYYLTVTYTRTATCAATNAHVFINGIEADYTGTGGISQGGGAVVSDASNNMGINSCMSNGTTSSCTANNDTGLIDGVILYNYIRTQDQIIQDMNVGHPVPGSPVGSAVGYWKFDEGYSTTAHDSNSSTGGAEDLTLNSASSWTNNGKFNKGWHGDGTQWLSRADDNNLDFISTDNLTISGWFKTDSTTNAVEDLVSKYSTGGATGYYIRFEFSTGKLQFNVEDGVHAADTVTSLSDVYDGNWHYFTAIKEGTSRIAIYIDGVLQSQDTSLTTTGDISNGSSFIVGDLTGINDTEEFTGSLDEIKVFRSALTQDQINLDLNKGSAQVMGSLSSTQSAPNSATSENCIPGDSSTCTAPVGKWDFEEGTGSTANDSSGSGNTGSWSGSNSYWSVGKMGKAGNFNGIDHRVTLGSTTGFSTGSGASWTIEAWVKTNTLVGTQMIAGYGNGVDGSTPHIAIESGLFRTSTWGNLNDLDGTSATVGTWYHVAGVASGTTLNLYVNGALNGGPKTITNSPASGGGRIGVSPNATDNNFNGQIDGVKIYNYARTPAQIAWDYNRGAPVGWWKFDECQGTALNDSSGNNASATITIGGGGTSSVGTCATSGAWANGVSGKNNYSLSFDGVDDYAKAADTATLSPAYITVSAWVKPSATISSNTVMLSKRTSFATADSWVLYADNNGKLNFNITTNGSSENGPVGKTTLNSGTWYHVVGVYDQSTIKVYVNGVLEDSINQTGALYDSSAALNIGTGADGSWNEGWKGQIDDVKVFNYALNATQIRTLYNDGVTRFGPASGTP